MSDPPLEARIAVVESKIEDIEGEYLRTRRRLHDLESDRATLRLLVQQASEMVQRMEQIAQSAAEKAIAFAFKDAGIPDAESFRELRSDVRELVEAQAGQAAVIAWKRFAIASFLALVGALAALFTALHL